MSKEATKIIYRGGIKSTNDNEEVTREEGQAIQGTETKDRARKRVTMTSNAGKKQRYRRREHDR